MSDQITYDDKADLIVETTIDDMFKVSASDMNEIKNVVNSHADDIDVANNNITDLNNNKLDKTGGTITGDLTVSGTLTGTLNGSATSAGSATNSTNATNTGITNTNPTSQTTYYPTFVDGTSGNKAQRVNNGLVYITKEGTTGAVGEAYLRAGNSTASGTADNKKGFIQLYGQNTGRSQIEYSNTTSNVTQTLPALSGTFVVKQSATISTETNGWYKVNMGGYTQYFLNVSRAQESYSANGYGAFNVNLPSGVTFNSAKMVFSSGCVASNQAVIPNASVLSGKTQVVVGWANRASTAISTQIHYNFSLIVFP